MKKVFKLINTDNIIKQSLRLAGALLLLEVLTLAIAYFFLPPVVPLFNQLPWGEERLGTRFALFLPVIIPALFLFLNIFLINHFYEKMPLASRMLGITTLLIALLSAVFIMQTLHIIL